MSNIEKMQSAPLTPADVQNTGLKLNYEKRTDIQFAEPDGLTAETILNISKQGRLRLQNQPRPEGALKKAGETGQREAYEAEALARREQDRRAPITPDRLDLMQMDEPDTYIRCIESRIKAHEYERGSKEYEQHMSAYYNLSQDWFDRRCQNARVNPVAKKCDTISSLQSTYSDAVHDTTFDVYASKKYANLWKHDTKFSVLMSTDMLNELAAVKNIGVVSGTKNDSANQYLKRIDDAVRQMKEAEKNYEGTHKALRFGVILEDSGSVTFHAKYSGCEDENGISANSAEELLEKLMAK